MLRFIGRNVWEGYSLFLLNAPDWRDECLKEENGRALHAAAAATDVAATVSAIGLSVSPPP